MTANDWIAALRGPDGPARAASTVELAGFLRGTVARGFGNSLNESDLDDVVQETLLRIHTKIDSFSGRSRFTTWAASIAVNTALSELRRRQHQDTHLKDAIAVGEASLVAPEGPRAVKRVQGERILSDAVKTQLTELQRDAFTASLGGLPLPEIATRMGTSPGALYKLLHDARKRLRARFDELGLTMNDLLPTEED